MKTKPCPKCAKTKAQSDFAKSRNRPDGLSGWCKACLAENKRVWTAKQKHQREANHAVA